MTQFCRYIFHTSSASGIYTHHISTIYPPYIHHISTIYPSLPTTYPALSKISFHRGMTPTLREPPRKICEVWALWLGRWAPGGWWWVRGLPSGSLRLCRLCQQFAIGKCWKWPWNIWSVTIEKNPWIVHGGSFHIVTSGCLPEGILPNILGILIIQEGGVPLSSTSNNPAVLNTAHVIRCCHFDPLGFNETMRK